LLYQGVKPSKRVVHLDEDKKICYPENRRREAYVSEKKRGKMNGQAREARSQKSPSGVDASRVQLARSVRESRNRDNEANGI
jgi:hypothetical protein